MQLLSLSHAGSMLLKQNLRKIPMILARDFYVDSANDNSILLIRFLVKIFELCMNNYPRQFITKYGTIIVAVFSRYLHNVIFNTYLCHKFQL